MFSYNFFPNNSFNTDFSATGKATTNLTFEKCSIRQAGWSSSQDSLEKITQIKQGQTAYMYISTNNCVGEEITFELYRLKKRFILKDALVLVASSTKTVSSSNKLSDAVVASINTEDGTSSNYRFRVRLTKYLPATNQTTNATQPLLTNNQTTNATTNITKPPINNISGNVSVGSDLVPVAAYIMTFYKPGWPPAGYPRYSFRNIGDVSTGSSYNIKVTITKNGVPLKTEIRKGYPLEPGGYYSTSMDVMSFSSTGYGDGIYCFEELILDVNNNVIEVNENNNNLTGSCVKVSGGTFDVINLVECNDQEDNDGDFLKDYPGDKGCETAEDTSEAGPDYEQECLTTGICPDLVPEIKFTDLYGKELPSVINETIVVPKAYIWNLGTGTAEFFDYSISFKNGGDICMNWACPVVRSHWGYLGPNQKYGAWGGLSYSKLGKGTSCFEVIADINSQVTETNENNNQLLKCITFV